MTEPTQATREDRLLHLRLSRPAKRNAITQAMYSALADALEAAETDGTLAVLISGEGEGFCAGNDLADFLTERPKGEVAPVSRFLRAIATSSRLLIAAVQGHAIGVGATMLLHCDFVFAEPTTVLHFPFVDLGIVPEAASTLLLPAAIGHLRAAQAFLLAEPMTASRSEQLGLVTSVTADCRAEARRVATQLLEKPEGALLAAKRLMKSPSRDPLARIDEENREFSSRLQSPELRETIARFFAARGRAA